MSNRGGEARKYFFFEKKKQKTFVLSVYAADTAVRTRMSKSFLVLFFKKELLFYRLASFRAYSKRARPARIQRRSGIGRGLGR